MAPKDKTRIFLDTNVIFSALHSKSGAPATILKRFINGDIQVIISQQVLDELILTLKAKLPEGLQALKRLLSNTPPEIVPDPAWEEMEIWLERLSIGDAAILAAAFRCEPDFFVTGDNHFLKNSLLAGRARLKIVTPAEFLRTFEHGTGRAA